MSLPLDLPLVDRIAREAGLDATLLRAVILQESGGNPYAYRPEPRYRWFWDVAHGRPFRAVSPDELASKVAPPDFPRLAGTRDQEWWGQQASWGLGQIMGALAREYGYRDPYLPGLCDQATNLSLTARILVSHLGWAHGNERMALGAYNAGRGGAGGQAGQSYADAVLVRKSSNA